MLVGSGPYQLQKQILSIDHIKETRLKAYDDFYPKRPYIDEISLFYFADTEATIKAFNKKTINSFVIESKKLSMIADIKTQYKRIPIIHPDIFGIFAKYSNQEDRKKLTDIEKLIRSEDISQFGYPWNQPLPPWNKQELLENDQYYDIITELGNDISMIPIEKSGSRILVTNNQEPLQTAIEMITKAFAVIKYPVEKRILDFNHFKNTVIPARSFDYLLFGQRYRFVADSQAYWNSSQRNDPGLNVTAVINGKIDELTDKLTENLLTNEDMKSIYNQLNSKILNERIFLPLYLDRNVYIFDPEVMPVRDEVLYNPTTDRFNTVSEWYLNTTLKFK